MRVTIDIPDALRAEIMAMSARKGYRGYGRLIVEALEHYVSHVQKQEAGKRALMKMRGSWTGAEATETRLKVAETRANWENVDA